MCCPRDAVSRTAHVERNGGQKWVNLKGYYFCLKQNVGHYKRPHNNKFVTFLKLIEFDYVNNFSYRSEINGNFCCIYLENYYPTTVSRTVFRETIVSRHRGIYIEDPLKPLKHKFRLIPRGLGMTFCWAPIMTRSISLSDSRCNLFLNTTYHKPFLAKQGKICGHKGESNVDISET